MALMGFGMSDGDALILFGVILLPMFIGMVTAIVTVIIE